MRRADVDAVLHVEAVFLVEVRLSGFSVGRHFGVDDFAQRIEVERHAAIVAKLGFETALMTTDLGYARFFEQG